MPWVRACQLSGSGGQPRMWFHESRLLDDGPEHGEVIGELTILLEQSKKRF